MADILVKRSSSIITIKKIETTVPSKRLIVQEIPIVLTNENISVTLTQVETINATL
jgi:hypothetical protein